MKEENKWEGIEDDFPYQDILFLKAPNPRKHPRQSIASRAGQFSPFAALTGYDGQIREVSRYVSHKKELSESEKEELDEKMQWIQQQKNLPIQVTYFVPDAKKKGGTYQEYVGVLRRIDSVHHKLLFCDKMSLNIQDIVNMEIIESSD